MEILSAIIGVIAALTAYQWGAEIWRGQLVMTNNQHKWVAAFLWISGLNFIFRAVGDVAKYFAG